MFFILKYINTKDKRQMDEPWYQTQRPSRTEVVEAVEICWFVRNFRLTSNEYHNKYSANKLLRQKYNDLYNKKYNITLKNFNFDKEGESSNIPVLKYNTITFESLKMNPDATTIISKIIDEEISKRENGIGFGSYRGFQIFTIKELEENIMKRAIQEIWCVMIITKWLNKNVNIWLEKRYAPNGKGYLEAKERFENNIYEL